MGTDRGVAAAMLALALLSLSAAWIVRRRAVAIPAEYIATDQAIYYAIARAPFSDDPEVHHPPGSFRILPALVARAIGAIVGGGGGRGFFVLTYACFALIPMATIAFVRGIGVERDAAIGCGAVAALLPPLVAYGSWAVANPDVIGLLLTTVGAIAVVAVHPIALVVTVVALCLTKETVFILVWFALVWAILVDRRLLAAAAMAAAGAVIIRGIVLPRAIPPGPEHPYPALFGFYGVLDSLSIRYVARRVLLGSAATFNVVLPFAAAALVRERATPRGIALWTSLGMAAAQMLFASDNQRVVAAGAPFALAAYGLELNRYAPTRRIVVAAAVACAQIPWLLEYGRLAHVPAIRVLEIAIFLAAAAVVVRAWRQHPNPIWPSVAAPS